VNWGYQQRGGVPANEYVRLSRERKAELDTIIGEIQRQRGTHAQCRRETHDRYRRALEELVNTLVPSLEPNVLGWAAWATGYAPLGNDGPRVAMERERKELEARIAAIEVEPRYAHRELLRAPRVGSLVQKVTELMHYRAPLADVVTRCDHPRMDELIASGYDTPDYKVPFWRTAYYANWKAGDEVLERFPEKQRFADIRTDYLAARDSLSVYDAELAEVRREIRAGEELEAEYEKCRGNLANIEERYLQMAREALGRHLSEIDLAILGERFAQAPHVEILAKRVAGLGQKLHYLDRIAEKNLHEPEAALRKQQQKMGRDIAKYSRPKHAYTVIPVHVAEKRSVSFWDRHRRSQERFEKHYGRVYAFDAWDRGRLAQDFLWWDLMTDGRIDGDFIPEVHDFHQRYPDARPSYGYDRDDHGMHAAAAVAGSRRRSDDIDYDAS